MELMAYKRVKHTAGLRMYILKNIKCESEMLFNVTTKQVSIYSLEDKIHQVWRHITVHFTKLELWLQGTKTSVQRLILQQLFIVFLLLLFTVIK